MVNKWLILGGCILLTACGERVPVAVAYKAPVAVAAACVSALPREPRWHRGELAPNADSPEQLKALIADYLLQREYIYQLKAVLAACQ